MHDLFLLQLAAEARRVYQFEIPGRVVPYTRMTQRSKFISPAAQRYLRWKSEFAWAARAIMLEQGWERLVGDYMLRLWAVYRLPGPRQRTFDVSNILKGVEDALQGVVYENDNVIETAALLRLWGCQEYALSVTIDVFPGSG